jgi:hypothetical protein
MDHSDVLIEDYLTRYAASLTDFDAKTAADLWATPGVIVDDRFSGVLDSREAMVKGLEQSYPSFQQLGLSSVKYELLRREQLSDALTLVHVRWLFLDSEGEQLTDSISYYILRRADDDLRACVCVQTDDFEKSRRSLPNEASSLPRDS